jgi:hypothetical protein
MSRNILIISIVLISALNSAFSHYTAPYLLFGVDNLKSAKVPALECKKKITNFVEKLNKN